MDENLSEEEEDTDILSKEWVLKGEPYKDPENRLVPLVHLYIEGEKVITFNTGGAVKFTKEMYNVFERTVQGIELAEEEEDG